MGCRELRAPLNFPATPSNFCREPKAVLDSIHKTIRWLLKMQLGSLKKTLFRAPHNRIYIQMLDVIVPVLVSNTSCQGKSKS